MKTKWKILLTAVLFPAGGVYLTVSALATERSPIRVLNEAELNSGAELIGRMLKAGARRDAKEFRDCWRRPPDQPAGAAIVGITGSRFENEFTILDGWCDVRTGMLEYKVVFEATGTPATVRMIKQNGAYKIEALEN